MGNRTGSAQIVQQDQKDGKTISMTKKSVSTTKRSAASGRFVTKSIGTSKAAKFGAVEGLSLNGSSRAVVKSLTSKRIKGEVFRSAVTGHYKTKSR